MDPMIDNMSLDEIKEYLINLIITEKNYKKDIEKLDEEIKDYKSKLQIALSENQVQLIATAENKVNELTNKKEILKNELAEIDMDIEMTKDHIHKKANSANIKAEQLLSDMESLVGKNIDEMKTDKQIKDMELSKELENLKNKMKE